MNIFGWKKRKKRKIRNKSFLFEFKTEQSILGQIEREGRE